MRRFSRMTETLTDLFASLFDPKVPILFVLGGLLLAVMGNAAYDFLLLWLGSGWVALLAVFSGSVVLLGLVVIGLYAVLGKQWSPVVLGPEEAAERRRGLILFLSTGEGKADEEALRHHAPALEYAWLIVTDEVREEGKADRLTLACRAQGVDVRPLDLKRPRDAREAHLLVMQALAEAQERGLAPGSLYVDITGCLRPSAVGATKACLEAGYDIEYVLARYEKGRVVPGTSRVMEVAVRPAGQKVEES
jgi:hypothetical protein